jgi:hypothetical protein
MDAGIDKLTLTTRDFSIKNVSVLGQNRSIRQGKTEEEIPVLGIDTGFGHMEMIRANSVYFNDETGLFNFSVNQTGAQVIFNPSKILHPVNLVTDLKEVKKVGDLVTKRLHDQGINVSLNSANVSRLDLAKQEIMTRSLRTYSGACAFIKGKRMSGINYGNGYSWRNGETESVFYDKGIESNLPIQNLNRLEVRLKTTKAVQKRSGLKNYGDMLHSDVSHLTGIYNRYLNDVLFSKNVSHQTSINFEQEVEKLKHFKSIGRSAVSKYLLCNSINSLISQYGTIDVLFDIMAKAGFSKGQISKERQNIISIMQYIGSGQVSELSIPALINELRLCFAA